MKKYIPKYDFIGILYKNISQNTILYEFYVKIHPKIRFYRHFLKKYIPKCDF